MMFALPAILDQQGVTEVTDLNNPRYCPQDNMNFFDITVTQEGTWNPSQLTTKLWLDATDNSTITLVSSAISQWNDKSGNGHHCSQSNSTIRPIISNELTINLKQLINFPSSNHRLTCSNWNPSNNYYYCFIVFYLSSFASFQTLFTQSDANNDRTGDGYVFTWTPSTSQIASQMNGGNRAVRGLSIQVPYLFQSRFINGSLSNNLNYGSFANYTGTISKTMTRYSVNGGIGTNGMRNVSIGEILIINTELSSENIEKIEGYLAWKWNLVNNLPSLHPYKSNPPNI